VRRLVLLVVLAGCRIQIAHWEAAVPVDRAPERPLAPVGRYEGQSCRWWVLIGFPLGLPQIDEAMARALAAGDGVVLRDVTLSSDHDFYGLLGRNCYTVRGDVYR
jgi:hypothetical protein